jgi:hypothetical protein
MTTANPPAPSGAGSFFLFRPAASDAAAATRTGRISTWPFRVVRETGGHGDSNEGMTSAFRRRASSARRPSSWWPPET